MSNKENLLPSEIALKAIEEKYPADKEFEPHYYLSKNLITLLRASADWGIHWGWDNPLPWTPSPKDQPEGQDLPDDVKTHLDNKMRPYHNRLSYRAGALDLWEYLQTPETSSPASEAGMSQEGFDRQTKANELDMSRFKPLEGQELEVLNKTSDRLFSKEPTTLNPTAQGEIPEEIKDWIKENKPKVDVGLDPEDYASEVGEQRGWAKGAIACYHKMQEEIKEYRERLKIEKRKWPRNSYPASSIQDLLNKYPQGKEGGK